MCWRGCLALQVLIHVATTGNESALSAVVGLLDRYSEVLLATAATEQDHLVSSCFSYWRQCCMLISVLLLLL